MTFTDKDIEQFLANFILLHETSILTSIEMRISWRFARIYEQLKGSINTSDPFASAEKEKPKQFIRDTLKDDPFYLCDMYAKAFSFANKINDFYDTFAQIGKKYIPDGPWYARDLFIIPRNKFCKSLSLMFDFLLDVNEQLKKDSTLEEIKTILVESDCKELSPRMIVAFPCGLLNGYDSTIKIFAESIKAVLEND